jgi:hypothetical protein
VAVARLHVCGGRAGRKKKRREEEEAEVDRALLSSTGGTQR